MVYYTAFGLKLRSEIPIEILPPQPQWETVDVTICRGTIPDGEDYRLDGDMVFSIQPGVRFRITGGDTITVDVRDTIEDGLVCVYLMGSCMGAILHQRNILPLHGSCVVRGDTAVLISGDSGAGKSTLAAEFLKNGWSLMTDDVAVIRGIREKHPVVQSSYPSQKLWQDAIDRYDRTENRYLLYQEERKDKFHVQVRNFREGQASLKLFVRLMAADLEEPYLMNAVTGFARVNQLVRNTYRYYMLTEAQRPAHFQACVDLSQLVPMTAVVRNQNLNTAHDIYEAIVRQLSAE